MRFGFRKTFAVAALAAVAATVLSGAPASAATRFAADGTRAGLTAGQVGWLQGEVNRYLARTSGQQTGLNVVKTATGAEFRAALPGEARPRNLSAAAASGPCDGGTAPGYLCVYSGPHGTGSQIAMYTCGGIDLPNWNGYGSWGDNQTPGTVTYFYTQYYGIADKFTAKSNNQNYNWTPVWHIDPC